jgi:hypothetical protein
MSGGMEAPSVGPDAGEGGPRSVVHFSYICGACGERSSFDGTGGEWCPVCRSADHLVKQEILYRRVEIQLQ